MKTRIMLAGLAAVTMTAVGTTTASARMATDTSSKTRSAACIDSLTDERQGTFTWEGPTASWPPNHKDIAAQITLTDEDTEELTDDVSLTVVGVHDEATYDDNVATGEMNGSGNTDPATDSRGGVAGGTDSASVPVAWRSERSGRGDGRTYTFTATGTTDSGLATCDPVTFTVEVPHDQGQGAGKPKGKKGKRARR